LWTSFHPTKVLVTSLLVSPRATRIACLSK
jgi:hypothetical protein